MKDSLHVRAVGYGRNASAPSGLADRMNTGFDGQGNVTSGRRIVGSAEDRGPPGTGLSSVSRVCVRVSKH